MQILGLLCWQVNECGWIGSGFLWLAVQSDAVRAQLRVFTACLVLLLANTASTQVLPKPQIPSAQGKPAPDFTLKDQDGRPFHLGSLRGKRVLLVFYRGYW
jgi:AhpC/TSA family protein